MRIDAIQIKNCFGFRESGEVKLSDDGNLVYILGRNSSGKTALLSAVEAVFSEQIPDKHPRFINFESSGTEPELVARFSDVSETDVSGVFGEMTHSPEGGTSMPWAPGIGAHNLMGDLHNAIDQANQADASVSTSSEFQRLRDAVINQVFQVYLHESPLSLRAGVAVFVRRGANGGYLISADPTFKNARDRLARVAQAMATAWSQARLNGTFTGASADVNIGGTTRHINLLTPQAIENLVFRQFPHAVRFDQRERLSENLPDGITIEDIGSGSAIVSAFLDVLQPDTVRRALQTHEPRRRRELVAEMQERANALTGEINASALRSGVSGLLAIQLDTYADSLQVVFYTDGKPSPYRHLSDNTKLLFAYFVLLHAKHIDANILLFDEPNNGFHATAQEDLLRFLEALAGAGKQVIVSTHSEHLLDLDHLSGVRLMVVDANGQYLGVRNKWNTATSGPGDVLAFRPVLDAIGLRYGASHLTLTGHMIVMEGLTDMLYLRAFSRIFGRDDLHIVPANGDKAIIPVVALLIGQQLSFKVVVDTSRGKTARDHLVEAYDVSPASIFQVAIPLAFPNASGSGIEDVFSKADFKHILTEMGSPPDPAFDTMTNNQYLLDPMRVPKRLVANWFLQHASAFKPGSFDAETCGNVEALLDFCANSDWCSL